MKPILSQLDKAVRRAIQGIHLRVLTLETANSGTNTGDEVAASETVSGVVELATQAEVDAGSDAVRVVTPATLAALAARVTTLEGFHP